MADKKTQRGRLAVVGAGLALLALIVFGLFAMSARAAEVPGFMPRPDMKAPVGQAPIDQAPIDQAPSDQAITEGQDKYTPGPTRTPCPTCTATPTRTPFVCTFCTPHPTRTPCPTCTATPTRVPFPWCTPQPTRTP